MTMTVGAGVVLHTAQAAAVERGLFLPLDIGARGSATIGGNVATNAGGIRVLRWGMARDMVLGLEAVLADGSVVSSMNKSIKNNAGYDWKHLLIGSEGTLGIITRVVLRTPPRPTKHADGAPRGQR
jgi:FAD/FMN-containing dehydrogenase